jgi:PIN domain nuclease of toxin-antitoxin system
MKISASAFVAVTFLVTAAIAGADDSAAIAKLIDDINAAVRTDKQRMLSMIVINTDVAAATLEKQKERTGLSFGDIYVAHSLSLATKKKFDAIVALKKRGQTWTQIARAHKVSLKGATELREMMKSSDPARPIVIPNRPESEGPRRR